MGTNYHWHETGERECPCCKRTNESLHIGKSSWGWAFSLRVHPHEGINNLDDWKVKWATPGSVIFDEYGAPVTVEEMLATITERDPDRCKRHTREPWGLDVRPGDGTYDLCNYEFS